MAEIAITYDARTTVPLDTVTDFQGDAKQITQDNLDKLKRSILKHGFFVPMFVWKKSASSKTYIIDGHQRLKALMSLRDDDGHTVPDIPVEYIAAKSKKDAAEKLLAISSQFGDFDFNGLREFGELVHLDIAALEDIRLVYNEMVFIGDDEESDVDLNEYSKKITAPIYEPTGEKPEIGELTDTTKLTELVAAIEKANITEDERAFLLLAAQRHTVFDYGKIAEYYAQSPEEIQRLMEASALVIIDFDKAIEGGFVRLTESLRSLFIEEKAQDDT